MSGQAAHHTNAYTAHRHGADKKPKQRCYWLSSRPTEGVSSWWPSDWSSHNN